MEEETNKVFLDAVVQFFETGDLRFLYIADEIIDDLYQLHEIEKKDIATLRDYAHKVLAETKNGIIE